MVSYAAFFGCVRVWCSFVGRNRSGARGNLYLGGCSGDEGCLAVLAAAFWAIGGRVLLHRGAPGATTFPEALRQYLQAKVIAR